MRYVFLTQGRQEHSQDALAIRLAQLGEHRFRVALPERRGARSRSRSCPKTPPLKILDFGLAKLRPQYDPGDVNAETRTASVNTEAHSILGTVGYMFAGTGSAVPAVCTIVRRAHERAAIASLRKGAHLLRHSLATEMLRKGGSLAEIGEILRHRSVDTTAIYAKVDLTALQDLAQPWLRRG